MNVKSYAWPLDSCLIPAGCINVTAQTLIQINTQKTTHVPYANACKTKSVEIFSHISDQDVTSLMAGSCFTKMNVICKPFTLKKKI